jgi:hypothetical protein
MIKETHNELYKFNNDLWAVIYGLPNTINISFKKLYNFLEKLEPIKLKIFIDTNLQHLKSISHELIILIKDSKNKNIKLYHDAEIDPNIVRSMYDKLFIKIINIKNLPDNNVTLIFKEFIKGITYFRYQSKGYIKDPVYHRLFSCGDGKNSFRNEFNRCNKSLMNKKKLKEVSKRIKTCFLERLVYDKLYLKNQFQPTFSWDYVKKTQDQGHTNWLNQTYNDFNTCFPDISIIIKLKFFNSLYPNYLMIIWRVKKQIIFIEEYIKFIGINSNGELYYKDKVIYIKRNKNTTYFVKTNFDGEKIKYSKQQEDNLNLFTLLNREDI